VSDTGLPPSHRHPTNHLTASKTKTSPVPSYPTNQVHRALSGNTKISIACGYDTSACQVFCRYSTTIPVACQSAAKKFSWYSIVHIIHVGSAECNYPTMMAISAKGDPFPNCTTMVSPPASRENTWASSADLPIPAEPSIPILSPYSTQTTIGPTVANFLNALMILVDILITMISYCWYCPPQTPLPYLSMSPILSLQLPVA